MSDTTEPSTEPSTEIEITADAKESSRRILNYIHAIVTPLVQAQFARFHHSIVTQHSCLLALPILETYFNSCAEALTGGKQDIPGGINELTSRFDSFKVYGKHHIDILDDIQTIVVSLMKHVEMKEDTFEQQIIDYLSKHHLPLAQACMLTCTIDHPVCVSAYQFVPLFPDI